MAWKPNLAAEGVIGLIKYPRIALIKLNGVRGLNQGGKLVARSLKPIPNKHVSALFSTMELDGFDGELTVGDPLHEEVFSFTSSALRSVNGTPDATWWLFDMFHPTAKYAERLVMLEERFHRAENESIGLIAWKLVHNDDEMQAYADECLAEGAEGIVLRDPNALYKQGRSTQEEGGFLRFCPWLRSEAVVIKVHEGQINQNESKVNELGYLKKQTLKENMVGSGQAGSWTVRDIATGIDFNMPVPTDAFQKKVWEERASWPGRVVKYKFKPAVKVGGRPRFPQFEGERMREDM